MPSETRRKPIHGGSDTASMRCRVSEGIHSLPLLCVKRDLMGKKQAVKPSMAASQQRPCCDQFLMGLHSLLERHSKKFEGEKKSHAVKPPQLLCKSSDTASLRCRVRAQHTFPSRSISKRLNGRRSNMLLTHSSFQVSATTAHPCGVGFQKTQHSRPLVCVI